MASPVVVLNTRAADAALARALEDAFRSQAFVARVVRVEAADSEALGRALLDLSKETPAVGALVVVGEVAGLQPSDWPPKTFVWVPLGKSSPEQTQSWRRWASSWPSGQAVVLTVGHAVADDGDDDAAWGIKETASAIATALALNFQTSGRSVARSCRAG